MKSVHGVTADIAPVEHIQGEGENWMCLCGNTPMTYGFLPCDGEGRIVEPTTEEWSEDLFVCLSCGRIIEQDTLLVRGQSPFPLYQA